ncbi:MAG: hypothetical protein ACOCNS_01625 [Bacteroidales bacterium]
MQEENDILERLEHPEREPERRKMTRNLFIRNILNSVFILMALVAMVGLLIVKQQPYLMWCYWLGLFAVIVKMVEVALRLPGMKK